MYKNMSRIEAFTRLLLGGFMTFYFFLGGPFWTIGGAYLLLSGCLRFCFARKLITG
ncbi:MAG: DUF2892 domain-containing protein [Bdellovibrionaceae bacterium]|nr:DUF2892 domain-containing protein [Pseudobdellovibrionaceae bacterium]